MEVRSEAPQKPALTERELVILARVADGDTNSAIARGLGMSPRTVAKHLEHAYRKLGVSSRAAAVSRVVGGASTR
ncbi:MAG TPA: LuxR C-terminal-related transcriptional regulator [Jatrophihabitantaceae bacterium]|jgi:DNA-binding CsgD family transcriptional regulator|nr:LuxR C-terminal-related transcriptional regulator [Jatrophihabitantaceae bacterium]